jgi:hypothetical protein
MMAGLMMAPQVYSLTENTDMLYETQTRRPQRRQRAARRTEAAAGEVALLTYEFKLRQQGMSGRRNALEHLFETVGDRR